MSDSTGSDNAAAPNKVQTSGLSSLFAKAVGTAPPTVTLPPEVKDLPINKWQHFGVWSVMGVSIGVAAGLFMLKARKQSEAYEIMRNITALLEQHAESRWNLGTPIEPVSRLRGTFSAAAVKGSFDVEGAQARGVVTADGTREVGAPMWKFSSLSVQVKDAQGALKKPITVVKSTK